jgi:hypothetical protein
MPGAGFAEFLFRKALSDMLALKIYDKGHMPPIWHNILWFLIGSQQGVSETLAAP